MPEKLMDDQLDGGYYAVIPGDVRYDPDLKPNAKLLYGELTSLCNKKGYCWATNEHFAKLYNLSVGTISRLISQLETKGYIRCEMAATSKGSERRIYAGIFLVDPGGIDEKRKTPLDEKGKGGLDDFGKQNNKSLNNKDLKEPPKAPQGGRRGSRFELAEEAKPILRTYVGEDQELARALGEHIRIRVKLRAVNSAYAVRMLLAKLDELSGGRREDKLRLIRQSVANSWKSYFPLRGGDRSEPPDPSGPGIVASEEVPTW